MCLSCFLIGFSFWFQVSPKSNIRYPHFSFFLFLLLVKRSSFKMVILLWAGPPPVEGAHSHFGLYWHNGNTISVSQLLYILLICLKWHLKYGNLKRFKLPMFLFSTLRPKDFTSFSLLRVEALLLTLPVAKISGIVNIQFLMLFEFVYSCNHWHVKVCDIFYFVSMVP